MREAKIHEKGSSIDPSWRPKSSQVASKIEVKNKSNLRSLAKSEGMKFCGMRGAPGETIEGC